MALQPHRRPHLIVVAMLAAFTANASVSYRDYRDTFVPKSPDRRRVAIAFNVDRNAVDRGAYETKLLQVLTLSRCVDWKVAEFLPRNFYNPDESLLAELRALEVDDLIMVDILRLKPPRVPGPGDQPASRRYDLRGTMKVINAATGNVVVEEKLEELPLPNFVDYATDDDAQALSLMRFIDHIKSFYSANQEAILLGPRCSADDAAAAAEAAGSYEEAAHILTEIIRKQPEREAELRDRRDLATLRAGRTPSASSSSSSGDSRNVDTVRLAGGRMNLLDPDNHGKLIPVTNGNVPVGPPIGSGSFMVSVDVLAKDASARGGLMLASRTKNVRIGLSPTSSSGIPQLIVTTSNNVTGGTDSRAYGLPVGSFKVNQPARLTARFDGSNVQVYLNGKEAIPPLSRLALQQISVFVFADLSTMYFQNATMDR